MPRRRSCCQAPRPRGTQDRPGWQTAIVCGSGALVVLGGALTSQAAGPGLGGAVTAFPTISTTLAVAVLVRGDRRQGAAVLIGLLRSLPAYLTFALIVAATAGHLGLAALGLATLAAGFTATITWRVMAVGPVRIGRGARRRAGGRLTRATSPAAA